MEDGKIENLISSKLTKGPSSSSSKNGEAYSGEATNSHDATKSKASSSQTSNKQGKSKPSSSKDREPREPMTTMSDIMEFLKGFQTKQDEKFKIMNDKVDELYYDYDEVDEEALLRDSSDEHFDEPTPAKMAKPNNRPNLDDTTVSGPEVEVENAFSMYAKKYRNTEIMDRDVDPGLANMVNLVFREGLSDEKLIDLMKSIHRPENCFALQKTRVNTLVWNLLSSETRTDDSKFQFIQSCVIKAGINLTKIASELNKMEQTDSLLQLTSDSLALLGETNKLINVKRKELHKPDLGKEYFHLSSQSIPFTNLLYGDDVTKNVKEIQDINRIGKKITSTGRSGYGNNNFNKNFRFRGRGSRRGRGSFRGRSRSNWGRWSNNYSETGTSSTKKDSKNSKADRK